MSLIQKTATGKAEMEEDEMMTSATKLLDLLICKGNTLSYFAEIWFS